MVSWLISWTGTEFIPAYYIMFAALVGMIVMAFVKKTSGKRLRGSPPAVAEESEISGVLKESDDGLWWDEEKRKLNMEIASEDEPYRKVDDNDHENKDEGIVTDNKDDNLDR